MQHSKIVVIWGPIKESSPEQAAPIRKYTVIGNNTYKLRKQYWGLSYSDIEAAYTLFAMANPSKNLPPTMQLKPLQSVRADEIDDLAVFENVASTTAETPTDATDGAVPGPSGCQRQETEKATPTPMLILYDTTKPKPKRRRKQQKVDYSSDSTSDEENVILARIQATKRELELAQKGHLQGEQKRKKM